VEKLKELFFLGVDFGDHRVLKVLKLQTAIRETGIKYLKLLNYAGFHALKNNMYLRSKILPKKCILNNTIHSKSM
jgi:hypothetical protein